MPRREISKKYNFNFAKQFEILLRGKSRLFILGFIVIAILLSILFFIKPPLRLPSGQATTTNSSVPGANEKPPAKGVAVPNGTYQNSPNNSSQTRIFSVSVAQNQFSFEKMIVREKDIVRIFFTPQDKSYDIAIAPLSIRVKAMLGQVTPIEFQAGKTGTFPITCESCPDPKPSAVLQVIKR